MPLSRVIAVDFGYKNIGLAVSDPLGITAQPLDTLARSTPREDAGRILRAAKEHSADRIVVGLPALLDGSEGELARAARNFGGLLAAGGDVAVEYYDERLTTAIVERMLVEEGGVSRAKRKKLKDRLAAVVILQNYLDRKNAGDA